jgi:hypothetical protein
MSEFNAEFWQWLRDKYPGAYEKWCLFYKKYTFKNAYYYDLEKFFDAQGIILFIEPEFYFNKILKSLAYIFRIIQENNIMVSKQYDNRTQAQLEAVKKAFEILNQQLENEK